MKLLHRHLLLELLWNMFLIMATLVGVFYVLALTFALGSRRSQGLPMVAVIVAVAYELISMLPLLVPMAVLSASIFTYGRMASQGEFTAWRAVGLSPRSLLGPALLVGAVLSLSLALLQNTAIPTASFLGRSELKAGILRNLESMLTHSDRHLVEKRWKAEWQNWTEDEGGRLVLWQLNVWQTTDDGEVESWTSAERTRCVLDDRTNQLILEMEDARRHVRGREPFSAGSFRIALDLDALSSRQFFGRRVDHKSYEELISTGHQLRSESEHIEDQAERRECVKDARKHLSEYHHRTATAFAPLLFALLGALLGLAFPVVNRALIFLVGFLLVVGLYYPLAQLGLFLGRRSFSGIAPSQWIGNLAIVALILTLVRRIGQR